MIEGIGATDMWLAGVVLVATLLSAAIIRQRAGQTQ